MEPDRPRIRAPLALAILSLALLVPHPLQARPFSEPGFDGPVNALAVYRGELIAAGEFAAAGGAPASCIARWNGTGWHPLGAGLTGSRLQYGSEITFFFDHGPYVSSLLVHGDCLIAAGCFTHAGEVETGNIASWDGESWQALGTGVQEYQTLMMGLGTYIDYPPMVHLLFAHQDRIHAGGLFGDPGDGQSCLVQWTGSEWIGCGLALWIDTCSGAKPAVRAAATFGDVLHLGGLFPREPPDDDRFVLRHDGQDWTADSAFDTNERVTALAVIDGVLHAAGYFTRIGGVNALRVARWQDDAWQQIGEGLPNATQALATYGGDLFAGSFCWNGAGWKNVLQTDGAVRALVEFRGRLIAGGSFATLAGRPCGSIAGWPDDPVAAWLGAFTVERSGAAAVLRWQVAWADEAAGFHVWREAAGPRERLTAAPLAGGASFAYTDPVAPREGAVYWLQAVAGDGATSWLGSAELGPADGLPDAALWVTAQPNPFNPRTEICYTVTEAGPVRLTVFDMRGRRLLTVVDGPVTAGEHRAVWDGRDAHGRGVAGGIYVVRLETGHGSCSRKLTLAR